MYNPKWFFSKMYRVLHRSMMAMSLNSYSGRLPKWGMMHNGGIVELRTSVRHINGNDGSAWLTPIQNDGVKSGNIANKYENGLSAQVMWTTPTTQDANPRSLSPEAQIIKTSTGSIRALNPNGTTSNLGLAWQNWGTPRASADKGTGKHGSKSHQHGLERGYIEAQAVEENKPHNLNPDWVELLMGYPVGYTDL